ncbi:LysR family transcriptional regulator [Micromonospora sp. NPDC050276]|uniref:LysR family transcriptional regulator n=1 Tax=Micromonospora sp. NPDC050276 TaxID=3364278 RepID=UPI00379903CC
MTSSGADRTRPPPAATRSASRCGCRAVAEHLTFSRAAKHLHLAQQSLSQQIGALEHGLGVHLFDRDTRGTRLTDLGRAFLPEARAVLARADAAIAVVQRAARGEVGHLSLAFLASTANYMLPPVVRAVRERFPDRDFAAAGFTPRVVQRAGGASNLLGLVAAGVGVTRLARSASSIRRTGVVFVPLAGDRAETVVAWLPARDGPAQCNLLDIAADLAATGDLTCWG